jgi:hypothetical protein
MTIIRARAGTSDGTEREESYIGAIAWRKRER